MSLDVISSTRKYYDDDVVDRFYHSIWGGETISIGTYNEPNDDIRTASMRTVEHLAQLAEPITASTRVLDLGAGYGGSARYLARTYGCRVTCLNLSPLQNNRNRTLCKEQALDQIVDVIEASFENIPLPDHSFDVIWSQDALLHAGDRASVLAEIDRLLVKSKGIVVLTDIMQRSGVIDSNLFESYMQRLPVDQLATAEWYQLQMTERGFGHVRYLEMGQHLAIHYDRILREVQKHEEKFVTEDKDPARAREYVDRSKSGLASAVRLANDRDLEWGILTFRR